MQPKRILKAFMFILFAFLFWSAGSVPLCAQEEGPPQSQFQKTQQAFNKQFAPSESRNSYFLVFAAMIGAVLVVVVVFVDRYYRSRNTKGGFYSEEGLFNELCKAHDFSYYQQRALRSVAKELRLEPVAEIFIEPRYLETALKEQIVPYSKETLQGIHKALFSASIVVEKKVSEEKPPTSWFTWTSIVDNPNPELLANPLQKPLPSEETDETQHWDPSLWEDVHRAARGITQEEAETEVLTQSLYSDAPVFASPPLRKEVEEMETIAYHPPIPLSEQGYYNEGSQEKGKPRRSLLDRRSAPRPAAFERPRQEPAEEPQVPEEDVDASATTRIVTPADRASYKPQYPDLP